MAAIAYDAAHGQVLMFGGMGGPAGILDDTWTWNGTSWTQESPGTSPAARYGAAIAYDAAHGQVVLFGGLDANGNSLGDTWVWNGTTWTQPTLAASPSARQYSGMAYDAAQGEVVLFGGQGQNPYPMFNDTWTWNGSTWTQLTPASSPLNRYGFSMAYDPAQGQVVLFGGKAYFPSEYYIIDVNDTWTWDGTTWTQAVPWGATGSPTARTGGSMAYDAALGQAVLFGGAGGVYTADTWGWNGAAWSELNSSGAAYLYGRADAAMAYDPVRDQMVLFGGGTYSVGVLSDTWTYQDSAADLSNANVCKTGQSTPAPCSQSATLNFNIADETVGSIAYLTQGAPNLDFKQSTTAGTCTATTYTTGTACTVNVTFAPAVPGERNGAVVFYSGANGSGTVLSSLPVYGAGTGPQAVFSPSMQSLLGGGFSEAYGVAVDVSGNVYVADEGTYEVTKMPPGCASFNCVTPLGGGFSGPVGVAVDGAGNVYVSNYGNGVVNQMPPGCSSSTCVTTLEGGFSMPIQVAVDGSGNVYVADSGHSAIKEIPPGCTSAGCVATLGGGFHLPYGVAVDGSGNVYVADTYASLVKEMPAGCTSASCVTTLGGDFNFPTQVAVDGSGNVYIADTGNYAVKEMPAGCASSSCVTTLADGYTLYPYGVAVDGNGNIYVADDGLVPEVNRATPPTLTFDPTIVDQTSTDSARTVMVQNIGNRALDFSAIAYPADFPEAAGATTDCSTSSGLPAAGFCTLTIDFQPTTSGPAPGGTLLSETVGLTDNALNAAGAMQSVSVQGISILMTPTITWAKPAAITYGTVLSATQLDAKASVPGTFAYTPPAGTLLAIGSQTLSVGFTPTDTTGYTTATGSVTITVNQAKPVITWATPAPFTYGTTVSAIQEDATANVAGTFKYSQPIGWEPIAGTHTLTVTFSPTDTTDYKTATASVTLTVNQATPVITWTKPATITYGTALSATQLDAKASVPGTFVYTPASGTLLTVGTQTLSVTFTPTDTADYTTATGSVTMTVNQAKPVITWATPAPFTYGTTVSATQEDATANVPGTFVYSQPIGWKPIAGTHTLSVTFTPTDATDYKTATASVTLTVNQATPVITWAKPATITYGTALSATQLDAKASVPGTFVYAPASGTVLTAGTQTLSVTFTPTDTADYTTATGSVTITVNQAKPVITWATPAPFTYGTTVSATQEDATANVAGTFVYSQPIGWKPIVGTHTLSVKFTPTDTADYSTATAAVTLTVNPAP
ncbi:MAG TPA: kelch repeat-containing protein [Acidobacteriaceae bacterium]|nr:kelch repeat-containing protein [Acidobacteriaceae bacterium]